MKRLSPPTAAAPDARDTTRTDHVEPVAGRMRRPAQPLSAARRPVDEAHTRHATSHAGARACGGYMMGSGMGGGFMLGSGN